MDRLCARIFLLVVTAGVLISNTELIVHLEPKNITVCEGDSVTLNCTFQPGGKYKVKWYYSQTPYLDCNSATDEKREKWLISTGNNDTWSTFNITSITTNDSGWYFCKVTRDIPVLVHNCSDGIQVLVDANSTQNQTENQPPSTTTEALPTTCLNATITSTSTSDPPNFDHPWWIWVALAVGCVVLVVSVVVLYILTRKSKDIIYENTKPVESGCWRRNRNQMDNCNLPASKKTETIKPLRKYDTLSSNRNRRP
ncbi:uncharacterized protein LOC127521892 isoform X2 [Ctenopharyngodon idella]|uniref:uncharacterized protein LOC127521892 isoform X2 n=1 Tax=Ctenopharyngodon idella TaxID=7959 RepID=UPI0022327527|nr:uncharacterized protein LOC127521892 isoform X2 [Ctenopharyngodon idella]XP_051767321.1 uncharacterized protein LOC127521892 isoform X2 [Ctenopharyngodon idella]